MVSETAQLPRATAPEHHVYLSGISWETYERLIDELQRAGRRLKLTYDAGDLEIEMPSEIHELIKLFLSNMMTVYFLEVQTPYYPVGETTYKRRLMAKGIEPDEAYYVKSIGRVSQKGDNDLEKVPPPDIAVEVEVSVPMIEKLPVYAAVGVPEVWHVKADGEAQIHRLGNNGYRQVTVSEEVPFFTGELLTEWVRRRLGADHFGTVQAFRKMLENPSPSQAI